MRLRSGVAARGPECPEESEWPLVAAGLKETGVEALLRHAAECDHCGPLLRRSVEDFSGDLTAEEEAMLERLGSTQAGWQERVAGKMSKSQRRSGIGAWLSERLAPARQIRTWVYAGAGLVLAAAASFWGLLRVQQPAIENLLATAYTEQRTLELRILGAAYGPVRLVRGTAAPSRLDRPQALLEGEVRIARELEKNPGSSVWLQAMGRADVLDRDYEAAIHCLERARAGQPGSFTIMIDLAAAYFERAEVGHREADYGAAVELLSKALQARPDDPVARFNRAIVYERMRLYGQAIDDWRSYLRMDPNGGWAAEARKRLADVEQARAHEK
jgi:tetratricopeptide (TPR) repeat protein